jgi:thiopeptide-type bacteriocin biosynthesis protein
LKDEPSFLHAFKRIVSTNDHFLEALYLASPVLHERTTQWLSGSVISEQTKLVKTLYKYWGRICSRATPYGLFSGVSLGRWGDHTNIVPSRPGDRVFIEPDILLLNQIKDFALATSDLKEKSLFYSNNSIYQVGNDVRFVEYAQEQAGRKYFISSIQNSEELQSVISLARNGCYLSDIRNRLLALGLSEANAAEFVSDLLEFQLLVCDLSPRITTTNGLHDFIHKLEQIQADSTLLPILATISQMLGSDRCRIEVFTKLKALIEQNFEGVSTDNLVQITLQQAYEDVSIEQSFREKIELDLLQIQRLSQNRASSNLTNFTREFYNKYGSAEIPLAIALDGELGIDYGHASRLSNIPVLEGIDLTSKGKTASQFNEWDNFVLNLYLAYAENQSEEINLTTEDINGFASVPTSNPSFYAFGNIIDESGNGKKDLKFHLNSLGGNSAAALLARFSSSNKALEAQLLETTAHEQRCFADSVLAEIVFLPETKTGNVLSHPPLYTYEIPYITLSSAKAENQLPVDDLLVSVTADGKVTIRSKKLGKKIIPRLSNAHNYGSELPIYQFLCDIQNETNAISFSWRWSILSGRPVLPRVTYNYLILSRKTWNIEKSSYYDLDHFIQKDRVPRYVQLIEGDNEMLLDLQLPLAKSILRDEIEKKGKAELREFLSVPSQCIINDQDGSYSNEVIIPLKSGINALNPSKTYPSNNQNVQRKFSFGDPWLYVQIYTGSTIADNILTEVIKPFCDHLLENGRIEKWFFIRYQDPLPHLRLRFFSNADSFNATEIVMQLKEKLAPFTDQNLIDKFVLGTYDRELERYGAENIELAETIFFIDSQLVINSIVKITEHDADQYRWLYACKLIDAILSSFGLKLDEKAALTRQFMMNFLGDYVNGDKVEIQLNEKFRSLRPKVTAVMETDEDYTEGQIGKLCHQLSADLSNVLTTSSSRFSPDQIGSFVHMTCNRLLISESREQELLIYHFLNKYYKGKVAQEQASARKSSN